MVAGADYHNAFIARPFNIFCPVFNSSSFYLYFVLSGGLIMKKLALIPVVIIALIVFIAHNNMDPKIIISKLTAKGDIRSGQLRYSVHLLGFLPVGEAIFRPEIEETYNNIKVYHLNTTARSLNIFSKIFNGYAELDSYIDMQEFNPLLFKQKVVIAGKPPVYKEVIYDQKDGVMTLGGVKRQILPGTQDPISMIFRLRKMDFDKIKKFETNINTNQKNYVLKGTAEQRNITINNKVYKVVLVKADISRRDKNPYHKSSISMVLLKEKANLPILIKVFAGGMFINAKLTDIE